MTVYTDSRPSARHVSLPAARAERATLAGLVAVGAALRLWQLGAHGFWRDEAQALFIAAKPFPTGILRALSHDGHPPLYYLFLHAWTALVGRDEWAIQVVSALCGIALIPLIWQLAREWFPAEGPLLALAAAFVVALTPLHIYVSREARMYSLVALLAALTLLWVYRAVVGPPRVRPWVLWSLTALALAYSHNWGLFLLASEALWVAGFIAWRRRRRLVLPAAVAFGAVGLLYLPWLPVLLQQKDALVVNGSWLRQIPRPNDLFRLLNEMTSLNWPGNRWWSYGALLALGTVGAGTVGRTRGRVRVAFSPALLLALVAFGGPLFVGVFLSPRSLGVIPNYVTMVAFPAVALLLGRAVASVRRPWLVAPLLVALVLLWSRALPFLYRVQLSSMREVAAAVQAEARPGDAVIVAPDYIATTFSWYFPPEIAQVAFPENHRVEEVIWADYDRRLTPETGASARAATLGWLDGVLAPGGRVFLVFPIEAYPNDPYFDQIRALKSDLDRRYRLAQTDLSYRNAIEQADVFIYEQRTPN